MIKKVIIPSVLFLTGCNKLIPSFEDHCQDKLAEVSTKINVTSEKVSFIVDTSKSYSELTEMAKGKNITVGLTSADLKSKVSFTSDGIKSRDGQVCLKPKVDVNLTFNPMIVYVAKEFINNPCKYNVIYDHEMKHVAVFENHLETAKQAIILELTRNFGNKLYIFETEEKANYDIKEATDLYLSKLAQDQMENVRHLQEQVDSEDEYKRLDAMCGGLMSQNQ